MGEALERHVDASRTSVDRALLAHRRRYLWTGDITDNLYDPGTPFSSLRPLTPFTSFTAQFVEEPPLPSAHRVALMSRLCHLQSSAFRPCGSCPFSNRLPCNTLSQIASSQIRRSRSRASRPSSATSPTCSRSSSARARTRAAAQAPLSSASHIPAAPLPVPR